MQTEQIWGLQQLKKSLRGVEKEEFFRLESALLDVLHRQRLFPSSESLNLEQDDIIRKLDGLAQNTGHKSWAALCKIPTTTGPVSLSSMLDKSFFSSLITSEQVDQASLHPIPDIKLLTEFVPVSYCYHQNEDKYPLITLHLDNRHSQSKYVANVKVAFDWYSEPTERQITIPAESLQIAFFLPLIRQERMKDLTEQRPATLRIEIQYLFPITWYFPYTRIIHLLSRNTAILWRCEDDGSLVDCTRYLAAWVTPRHPEVEKLVNKAARYSSMAGLWGYNISGNREEQAQNVREQVKAVFDVLHRDVEIVYVASSEKIQSRHDPIQQKAQLIRLPAEVIKAGGSANCLDGTVLFASLLEQANLHPLIFIQPGHALVGWRVFKDEPVYEFLETTIINKGDFQQALQEGQEQYEHALERGALGKTIIDPIDYAFLIDVADCRRDNIQPME